MRNTNTPSRTAQKKCYNARHAPVVFRGRIALIDKYVPSKYTVIKQFDSCGGSRVDRQIDEKTD